MCRIEELGRDCHGDREVGAELVVLVLLSRLVKIFIDPSPIHNLGIDVVFGIVFGVERNVVAALKICLSFVAHSLNVMTFNSGSEVLTPAYLIFAFRVELGDPGECAVERPVISMAAPSRGVPGTPLLFARSLSPILSIHVPQLYWLPPKIIPLDQSTLISI